MLQMILSSINNQVVMPPTLFASGWEYPALFIIIGSVLFTFGIGRVVRYTAEPMTKKQERIAEGVVRILLVFICFLLGAVVGLRSWDWMLGGVTGAFSSGASPILARYVFKFLDSLPFGNSKK